MLPHYRQVASAEGIARVAREAERLGYDSVWVSDHIVIPDADVDRFGREFYDPFPVLGYAAACTTSVQLGFSIIVVPYRSAIMVAKATATLDALSQGRLIVGVGAGALAAEFKNIDAPWEDRGDYTDEALGVFKELWTSESSSFQGKYFNFSEVQCYPKPVQKPHPPLWVGGNSPRSLRRAAELGDVWHPTRPTVDMLGEMVPRLRRMAERAGRNPDEIGIAARQPMKIVASESQAPKGWPLFGTSDSVAEGVERFEGAGVGHFVLDTFYSIPELHGETVESMLETMERFASTVMPRFR